MTYAPGDIVADKYQLLRALGEGNTGAVWEARNIALDVSVAIKLIRVDLNKEALAPRLLQEARAAARLGHPALTSVFDVGHTSLGDPFVVMELLHGRTLADIVRSEGPLEACRAVRIMLPIAEALGVAHAKGIVHGNIRTDDIFLSGEAPRTQPKLLDFGLTIGRDMDPRADVTQLCAALQAALTGRAPSPTERSAIDEGLWNIIRRGLDEHRDARWASMQELGSALAAWLVSKDVYEDACGTSLYSKWLRGQTRRRARRTSRSWLARLAIAIVGIAVFLGVRITIERHAAPRVDSEHEAEAAADRPLSPALEPEPPPSPEAAVPVIDVSDLEAEQVPEKRQQPPDGRRSLRPTRKPSETKRGSELMAPY